MPALRWCGRKWRTSSDDFVLSSIFFSVVFIISSVLGLMHFRAGDITAMESCPDVTVGAALCLFYLGVVDIIAAAAFLVTAWLSLQGTPFQLSKRRHVPTLLYVTTVLLLVSLVLTIALTKFAFYDNEFQYCTAHVWNTFRGFIGLNFFVTLCQIFCFAFSFDPSGSRDWSDVDEYETLWRRRCRFLCCCCFQSPHKDVAFHEAAKTLAALFRGYDMVPSDVVAGIILLKGAQKRVLRCGQLNLQFPSAGDGRAERISLQARRFPKLSDKQRQQVADLNYYSRFYMSAYGWLLYEQMHCCTGLMRLCCFDPLMCCRRRRGLHRGTRFYCDVTALLSITGLVEENILLTSWRNALFHPVFFVAVDPSTNSIIVSIRGTMSFVDCITDLVASPSLMYMPDCERDAKRSAEDYYVHGGMKLSAEYVLNELRETGVLGDIVAGQFKEHKLVVLGHSLGAGVASILSILLHITEPEIRGRLRCLAYAPPGGLLSQALVAYSQHFIVGCFVGNDVIPRMAAHTFDSLRESIFDALEKCSVPKFFLFFNCFGKDDAAGNLSSISSRRLRESNLLRDSLRFSSCAPLREEEKLYPPLTLVHYCKAVVRASCTSCLRASCCCRGSCYKYEEVFVPMFVTPKDVQFVVCSASMFGDHFPDRICAVIKETDRRLQSGELERFLVAEGKEEELVLSHRSYGSVSTDNISNLV